MASENPNPNVPSSESIAEVLAPLAQPETSDSAMETSSDDAASTDSREQKTDSCTDSPSHKSISRPVNDPFSEEESCLTAITLAQDDTASECSAKDLVSEMESAPSTAAPVQDESQPVPTKEPILAAESGPSAAQDKPKSLGSTKEHVFSAESGPSTSKDMSPSACSSEELISAAESPFSSVQETSPSDCSSKELFSTAESDIPGTDNDQNILIVQGSHPHSEEEPAVEPSSTFECSLLWDYTVHFFQKWQAYSIFITDSVFLVPVQVVLVALSVSAVAMGYVFANDCPVAKEIPVLILILGYMGALANCLRIAFVVYSFRSILRRYVTVQRGIIVIVNTFFLILFSGEFYTFFSIKPSFEPSSEDYCNPVFHTYAYVLNCVVIFLAILMSSIHLPAFIFNTFHIGGPGLPAEERF